MHAHMRTSIELPDPLFADVRRVCAARGITFRDLVIEGLHRVLHEDPAPAFRLADRSVGYGDGPVDAAAINAAIDAQRDPA
jgi:hypothetical protein